MSTRKKNTDPACDKHPKALPPPPGALDIEALLMIGEERVIIDHEENDNVDFMAEVIDSL
ncbi:hypothetical protein FHW83_003577 [Duganella sp. SG902]|uniref:hypothetical protein n=1 Tax=Duganella sp. SG902 TaxID=2587016 RepID=UPI00159D2920|nr:hypothetical protein [Duganella sp. SG902]NVM77754.1 hypothetical protein [Duganella sp. SG902]